MNSLKEILLAGMPGLCILENEPMANHTTFKIGGPADLLVQPCCEDELLFALNASVQAGVPVMVMGNGSNLLVRDGGIRGAVVLLGQRFSNVCLQPGNRLYAQAGASLAKVAVTAQRAGLTGLEFASGIPGTTGGAVAMNAGAYGGELSQVLESARVLENGSVLDIPVEEMEMGYRHSRVLQRGGVVLGATFCLMPGDPDAIAMRMRELNASRREKQPLELPSAGSTFKRPQGHFAGALIEKAELKGLQVGGAAVSTKHAGFVVNKGGATAADVLQLVSRIKAAVYEKFAVNLDMEIRVVGED